MKSVNLHYSKLLVSVSEDETVKIWDASNWKCLQTLEGHSDVISSYSLSRNFIEQSYDRIPSSEDPNIDYMINMVCMPRSIKEENRCKLRTESGAHYIKGQ